VRRFLKAGIMEDGAFMASDEGAPQGGLVSPVLSNIYLQRTRPLVRETSCGALHGQRLTDPLCGRLRRLFRARSRRAGLPRGDDRTARRVRPVHRADQDALLRCSSQCLRKSVARAHGERTFSFLGFTLRSGGVGGGISWSGAPPTPSGGTRSSKR
jgi:hypothetical protein